MQGALASGLVSAADVGRSKWSDGIDEACHYLSVGISPSAPSPPGALHHLRCLLEPEQRLQMRDRGEDREKERESVESLKALKIKASSVVYFSLKSYFGSSPTHSLLLRWWGSVRCRCFKTTR